MMLCVAECRCHVAQGSSQTSRPSSAATAGLSSTKFPQSKTQPVGPTTTAYKAAESLLSCSGADACGS